MNVETERVRDDLVSCFEDLTDMEPHELAFFTADFYMRNCKNRYAAGIVAEFIANVDWVELSDMLECQE